MFLRPPLLVKALGFPLVCLAMFSLAGGHWVVLQSIAWGQMLVDYSTKSGSLVIGAKNTFSGEYPCEMCKRVAEGKKKEQRAPMTLKTEKKAEISLVEFGSLIPLPALADFRFPSYRGQFWTRTEAPPVPVPIV